MKRFGVWMLVVLIAIMDVGFVRPGFAQSGEDDIVPIRGASKNDSLSGKTSVRGCVASWRQ